MVCAFVPFVEQTTSPAIIMLLQCSIFSQPSCLCQVENIIGCFEHDLIAAIEQKNNLRVIPGETVMIDWHVHSLEMQRPKCHAHYHLVHFTATVQTPSAFSSPFCHI